MLFIKTTTIAALLLILSAVVQLDALPFRYSSFGIKSVISIDDDTIHLAERYSRGQRRARIHYNVRDTREGSDLFFDANMQVGLTLNVLHKNCLRVTKDELYRDLRLDSKLAMQLFQSFGEVQESNHIVGPSKLLFHLVNQGSKMKLVETADENGSATRNRPTVEYQLEVQLDNENKATISAYYDRNSYSQDSTRSSVPLQVNVRFDGPSSPGSSNFSIAYFDYELIDDQKVQSRYGNLADLNKKVVLDMFAFPASYNCSSAFGDIFRQDLFVDQKALNARLTFEAETVFGYSRRYEHFVAFDGTIETLRIDSAQFTGRESASSQIWDYIANRKYLVSEVITLNGLSEEQQGTAKCSVQHIGNPKTNEPGFPSLASFLVGADGFVLMGRAQVRGIDALVYEASTNILPLWFSQPMIYLNKAGQYSFRNTTKRIREKDKMGDQVKPYSVVVYVARESDAKAPKKLLRLELFNMIYHHKSEFRRELLVDFKNFAYGLTESPNGDRADELFSLIDHCSSGGGADKYAQVDMLLSEDPSTATNEDATWLTVPNDRNQALLLGLNSIMKTLRAMMYDFSSRLLQTANKRSIQLSFRVAEHPRFVTWITFAGNAGLKSAGGQRFVAQSLSECIWIVGQRRAAIYLYFNEAVSLCVFDEETKVSLASDNLSNSKLFYINDNMDGELFIISSLADDDAFRINNWLRRENSRHLENREVTLINIESENGGKSSTEFKAISMRIEGVTIESIEFMSKSLSINNQQQILAPLQSYTGFALNELSDGNRRLMNEVDREIPLSREQCRAACLEDFDCRSYSFCIEGLESRCVLSDTSFTGPGIREQLTSREVLELRSGSQVEVQTAPSSKVTIERSLRCDLYNKFYLDLFKRPGSTWRGLDKIDLISARDEEECAEVCFRRSLDTMKLDGALGGEIKKLSKVEDLKSDLLRDRFTALLSDHKAAMTKFCEDFLYLDTSEKSVEIQAYVNIKFNQPNGTTSYCGFHSESSIEQSERRFIFEEYELDFSNLYEKHFGYGLKKSSLTSAEELALKNLNSGSLSDSANYDTLKQAVAAGKNFQYGFLQSAPYCAKQCFMQSTGPWPACRSFDMISTPSQYGVSYTCVLNSQVDTEDHVQFSGEPSPLRGQMWHYMPRFGLVRQQADEAYDLDTLTGRFKSLAVHMSTFLFGGFFTFIIVTIAIGTGLFLGVKLARRLPARSSPNIEVEECLSDMA